MKLNSKLLPPFISLIPVAVFSYLLIVSKISTSQFAWLTAIWLILSVFVATSEKLELFKVILQSITTLFAFTALILSLVTFVLESSPLLIIEGASLRQNEGKLYYAIKNVGKIGAYQIKGAYTITSNAEPSSGVTTNEKVLYFGKIEHRGEAFYPGVNTNIVVENLSVSQDLNKEEHVFLSIAINYPRLQFLNFTVPFPRGCEAVFSLNKETNEWVPNTKTLLPGFFAKIFHSLKRGEQPIFESGGNNVPR